MGIIDDLRDLLTDTATWQPVASRDAFGEVTYGSGTQFTGRLVRKNARVRNRQGDEVVSTAQLWLRGTPAIAPDDKITLGDGTSPPIVSIEQYPDEDGVAYTKVFFQFPR